MLEMEWKDQARCWAKATSPESDLWYPDKDEPEEVQKSKTAAAKAICHACPVKPQCLRYAIRAGERYGIWGGRTPRERSVVRRQWIVEGKLI